MKAMPELVHPENHYEVLALPSPHSACKPIAYQDIKLAYRRALLLHHPDKSTPSKPLTAKPSVDQITLAYKTLLNPTSRCEHDRLLTLKPPSTGVIFQTSHPGLETVDLDELLYDKVEGVWYRGCRCGKERAYVLTEVGLEANAEGGELVTGCQGCSLWLRVMFAVAADG